MAELTLIVVKSSNNIIRHVGCHLIVFATAKLLSKGAESFDTLYVQCNNSSLYKRYHLVNRRDIINTEDI